jgi:hypothetical protein
MKQAELEKMFFEHEANQLAFEGKCHDCKKEISVVASLIQSEADGGYNITIEGGAVYRPNINYDDIYIKCDECFTKSRILRNWQSCDVYTRCVGYYAKKSNMNAGKQAEVEMRSKFKIDEEVFA